MDCRFLKKDVDFAVGVCIIGNCHREKTEKGKSVGNMKKCADARKKILTGTV